jgi:hypothetical protein
MAKKVSVETIDDLDGTSTADTTINYSFDGTHYEIDLSTKNAELFRKDLRNWIDHSRAVQAPANRRGRRISGGGEDFAAIREWAAKEGIKVSPRGRIKSEIIADYHNRKDVSARASKARVAAAVESVVAVDSPEFSSPK